MKTKLFILLLITTLFACNKDDDNNGESLPAATQIGANTVGCLVNGEVFLPHSEGLSPSVNCNYEFIEDESFFIIAFRDLRGNSNELVSVQLNRIDIIEGTTYVLNKNSIDNGDFSGGGGSYFPTVLNNFSTNLNKTGEIYITRIDVVNSIISGTFWFDAINTEGVIVEIREGRFDWNY